MAEIDPFAQANAAIDAQTVAAFTPDAPVAATTAPESHARRSEAAAAQMAVDVAQRRVDSLTARLGKTEALGAALKSDLAASVAKVEFLKRHPALDQS